MITEDNLKSEYEAIELRNELSKMLIANREEQIIKDLILLKKYLTRRY